MADPNRLCIAVMGPTGVGKSSFINLLSGSNFEVSDSLGSCTEAVQVGTPFELDGRTVYLIDTPGFDDSTKTQFDVLKDIASFLEVQYKNGVTLHGVLYLHRVSDTKMGGIARRDLRMFRQLVGSDSFSNVVIVTTMWDRIPPQQGIKSVAELSTDPGLFKPMLDKGATMMHNLNVLETAQAIVRNIIQNSPLPLDIQKELVDEGKNISQTAACKEVELQAAELEEKHKAEIAKLQKDIEDAIVRREENAKKEFMEEIARLKAQMEASRKERENLSAEYEKQKALLEEMYRQSQGTDPSSGRETVSELRTTTFGTEKDRQGYRYRQGMVDLYLESNSTVVLESSTWAPAYTGNQEFMINLKDNLGNTLFSFNPRGWSRSIVMNSAPRGISLGNNKVVYGLPHFITDSTNTIAIVNNAGNFEVYINKVFLYRYQKRSTNNVAQIEYKWKGGSSFLSDPLSLRTYSSVSQYLN
ncbi:hypothetical protein FRC17_001514 [Serendipita sp. 399]|nr:hypothetical protein FRC17_001514 [Serendipita sp. 399]